MAPTAQHFREHSQRRVEELAEERRERIESDLESSSSRTRFVERQTPVDTDRYRVDDREGSIRYPDREQEEVIEHLTVEPAACFL